MACGRLAVGGDTGHVVELKQHVRLVLPSLHVPKASLQHSTALHCNAPFSPSVRWCARPTCDWANPHLHMDEQQRANHGATVSGEQPERQRHQRVALHYVVVDVACGGRIWHTDASHNVSGRCRDNQRHALHHTHRWSRWQRKLRRYQAKPAPRSSTNTSRLRGH